MTVRAGLCTACASGDHSHHNTALGGICVGCSCAVGSPDFCNSPHPDSPAGRDVLNRQRDADARLAAVTTHTRVHDPELGPAYCKDCSEAIADWVKWTDGHGEPDLVNHPPHYTSHPSGVECITVVEHMGFNLGNALKYIWRADEKGNALEDLRKAAWYVDREIERRSKP